jgi:hypothetical protein
MLIEVGGSGRLSGECRMTGSFSRADYKPQCLRHLSLGGHMQEPEISQRDRELIGRYLRLDEETLYSVLAAQAEGLRGYVFDAAGQKAAGKRIFNELKAGLRTRLCDEWHLCAKLDDASLKDATNLVVVVGDVVSAGVTGVPPFLVASLLVKIGLRQFCKC